jgi:hypothetical protein
MIHKRTLATFFLSLIVMFALAWAKSLPAATCTGADPCHACKNCKYCQHCAKQGGTCGVCKRS